jgi:HSP20 family protein
MSDESTRSSRDPRRPPHAWRVSQALNTLHGDVHHMLHRFLERAPFAAPPGVSHPSWLDSGFPMPVADVTESETAYHVMVELPGVAQSDIELSLADDILTVKGEKREEHTEKGDIVHIYERNYGSFQRAFHVPEGIDRPGIAAAFDKGVLTITLPKIPGQAPKQDKISIKIA